MPPPPFEPIFLAFCNSLTLIVYSNLTQKNLILTFSAKRFQNLHGKQLKGGEPLTTPCSQM